MADFYSYIPLLAKYLRTTEPKRILEWGTGHSTIIMKQLCPDAEIISIEHDKKFYDEYKNLESNKLKLYHIPIENGYSNFPLGMSKFDLVFVDGKDDTRPACLLTAFDLVTENGVVILHDSEREWYQNAISKFKVLENENGTIVLKK